MKSCWPSAATSWNCREEARDFLVETGYDPDYGARPLKRAIQRELQDPLALRLLNGDFHPGETILVSRNGEALEFVPAGRRVSSN